MLNEKLINPPPCLATFNSTYDTIWYTWGDLTIQNNCHVQPTVCTVYTYKYNVYPTSYSCVMSLKPRGLNNFVFLALLNAPQSSHFISCCTNIASHSSQMAVLACRCWPVSTETYTIRLLSLSRRYSHLVRGYD